jgi:3-oxoacyl-[acyl-carrier-protein] synthase-3
MESNDPSYGILVTADPHSKIINSEDRNTSLLFGDTASANVLCRAPVWRSGVSYSERLATISTI